MTTLTIKLSSRELILTIDEALELKKELERIFEKKEDKSS